MLSVILTKASIILKHEIMDTLAIFLFTKIHAAPFMGSHAAPSAFAYSALFLAYFLMRDLAVDNAVRLAYTETNKQNASKTGRTNTSLPLFESCALMDIAVAQRNAEVLEHRNRTRLLGLLLATYTEPALGDWEHYCQKVTNQLYEGRIYDDTLDEKQKRNACIHSRGGQIVAALTSVLI